MATPTLQAACGAFLVAGVLARSRSPKGTRRRAFPSLHLAVITSFVLASRRVSRCWFFANLGLAALTFLASLVTGYHYLVDSLAGVAVGALCYMGAARWTEPVTAGERLGGGTGPAGHEERGDTQCQFGAAESVTCPGIVL